MSGFVTTETVSSSSGLRGEADAGEFLTLPSNLLNHSSSEIAEQEEKKLRKKSQG